MTPQPQVTDRRGRVLRDLRVSVTDRCNFRCPHCMPREAFGSGFPFLPRSEVLTFEEIARVARVFQGLGTRKIRITGGEPLLRAQLWKLVEQLTRLPGLDVALTTNGALLAEQAQRLRNAGLRRVTVSLDSLEPAVFEAMTDSSVPVAKVLDAIDVAAGLGLQVKINAVVRRGVNDHTIVDLARRFRGTGHALRFIEYMDVGSSNAWDRSQVVTGKEIVQRLSQVYPLRGVEPTYAGEVARRWVYEDGAGEIGVITSVSEPFCGDCTRARLSADGRLYTCLFATAGTDLRALLRSGVTDDELVERLRATWSRRDDAYSERRALLPIVSNKIEMSYIGG